MRINALIVFEKSFSITWTIFLYVKKALISKQEEIRR